MDNGIQTGDVGIQQTGSLDHTEIKVISVPSFLGSVSCESSTLWKRSTKLLNEPFNAVIVLLALRCSSPVFPHFCESVFCVKCETM